MVKRGLEAAVQVKILWDALPVEAATWEDYDVLQRRYLEADIWKEVESQGEGNVTPVTLSDTATV